MASTDTYVAIFDDLEPAAEAITTLRQLGIAEDQMEMISCVPYSEAVLGRRPRKSNVPLFGGIGAIAGFVVSIALNWGTPLLYPIYVGGQPLLPVPTTAVLTFEITMLGLLIFSFLGVFWENAFPRFGAVHYMPEVSDGKIALMFNCPTNRLDELQKTLVKLGAEKVQPSEAKKL